MFCFVFVVDRNRDGCTSVATVRQRVFHTEFVSCIRLFPVFRSVPDGGFAVVLFFVRAFLRSLHIVLFVAFCES